MDPVVFTLAMTGGVIWILLSALRESRARNPPHQGEPRAGWTHDALRNALRTVSGHNARVESYSKEDEGHGVRLVVEGLCRTVALRRARLEGSFRAVDALDTGDAEFNGAIEAGGPPAQVHALLTAETRKALLQLLAGSVRVGEIALDDGELSVEVPTVGFAGAHPGLPQVAQAVGELARHLVSSEPVRERLAASARHDPVARARIENLFALVHLLPGDPFTLGELRAATKDPDPEIRLRAAMKLGPDGRDALLALAADEAVEDDISARAFDALGEAFRVDEAVAQVARACRDRAHKPRRPRSVRACIEGLAAQRTAEATIIEALDLRDEGVRVAAAGALGSMGSAAAVLPLKEAAERHGGALANAAWRAIAEIQSRLTGSPGELSLAEGGAGSLSLTDDVGGRISLPDSVSGRDDKQRSS